MYKQWQYKMEITVNDFLRINKGFGGDLVKKGSLEYAIDKLKDNKLGLYTKLAYLFRAILVDHPFSDGNKRTAMFFAFFFLDEYGKVIDRNILAHQIQSIAKNNITDIRKIKRRLMTAIQ